MDIPSSIMAVGTFLCRSDSSNITHSRHSATTLGQCLSDVVLKCMRETASLIHEWTPFLLVLSYFIFSTSLYIFCSERLIDIFWFFYLTGNFFIAGSTFLEALMSLEPCRDARLVVQRLRENSWVFPTPSHELVFLDLLIVSRSICSCQLSSSKLGRLFTQ